MVSNVTYIVDDQDEGITYLCPVQHQEVTGSYYQKTWTTIASESCGNQWFRHTFSGTGVSIAAPASRYGQNYTVQIDDGRAMRPYGRGYYENKTLQDGEHTVIYALGDESLFPAFDYLTVTAGSSTSLRGRTLIIDDQDDALQWSDGWSINPPSMLQFTYANMPYLESTHWSKTVGDTMTLHFTGPSVSVYGVLTSTTSGGDIVATYTLDGEPTVMTLPDNISNQTSPMARLFSTETTEGTHTLVVNITDVTSPDSYLGIDFVVYNSSLDDALAVQNSWGVSDPIAPTGSIVDSSEAGTNVAAIVGGVLGGIALVAILVLVFFGVRRNKQKKEMKNASPHAVVITKLENGSVESWADMKKGTFTVENQPAYLPPVLTKF